MVIAIGIAAVAVGVVANMASNHPELARARALAFIRASLDSTEHEQSTVPAFRRRWWDYFVPSHGVLAVTPRRMIFATVEPRPGLLAGDGPGSVTVESHRYDSVANVHTARVLAGPERTLTFESRGTAVSIGIEHDVPARIVDSIVSLIATHSAAAHEGRRCEARLAAALAATPPMRPELHVVARGEALFTVAHDFRTTVEEIRRLNALTNDEVRIGQGLIVRQVVDSAALRDKLPVCSAVPELSTP